MEGCKKNYKFYQRHHIKNFSFIFLTLLFPSNKISANETDKREYEKSCAHWIEDGQKIELLLQTGQPIKILNDNSIKKDKLINLVFDEIDKRKKYFFRLDNNLQCVFTEYSLEEIKNLRFDLILYDLCKFLGFGNVPPVVWRDDFVIDGKRYRGTLQLLSAKMDLKNYGEDDLRRSMSGISQRELDEYRIFNLLFGTWESSLENLSICGGYYLVHDDSSKMQLKQVFEKYGEVPFVLFHECDDKQVSKYINEYEDFVKKSDELYEQEKLKAKKERQKVREQLQKQKVEEEKKLQQVKDAFQKQKEAYRKQQQEILRQQEEFRKQQEEMMRKQQEEMARQQQIFQNQQNQYQNFSPQQNLAPNQSQQIYTATTAQNFPQQNSQQLPQIYDPFQNIPEPTNPQIDYLEQQIKFLDEQDELADAQVVEPFPFYSSRPLDEEERNKIACYYAYNPPRFKQNYIIWKHNYWLQFSDEKAERDIKYVLFPKVLTSRMKEKLQQFTKVRALEFFLKSRYYRMHEE
ncbi:MAG: hypothetical protein LBD32_02780, partial [Cytophagales bacterium]|nr:hypothetical protein [Cytophagales bacterium]